MGPCLEIFTFGGLRIVLDGIAVTDLTTRKVEALLVFLACSGQSFSRQQLADLLWDERSEHQALTNLRATLSRLKQPLEPFLSITRRTIGLNPEADVWVDAIALNKSLPAETNRERLSTQQINQLEAAVALYQGHFLEGFYINESAGFDNWLSERREYLQSRVLAALNRLIVQALEDGLYDVGVRHAVRALQIDPLREEAYQQLMTLLARKGQRSRALEQYMVCKQILQNELGVDPSQETTDLYEQIAAGKIGAPAERRLTNLPTQLTPFVGRSAETADLQQAIEKPDARLISLVGMGGTGKTRLAYRMAELNLQTFSDGVWFIPLVGLSSSKFLASSIAKALSLTWDASADVQKVLFASLRTREMLLVLDNFEHMLDDGPALVSDLLAHAPHVKILITSRERLGLREEWVFNVQGLTYPARTDSHFEEYGAVQLFVQGAQRVQPNFSAQQHSHSIMRICQIFEGLPLALELVTYWLKVMSCEQLAAELEHSLTPLNASFRNVPARHSSLQMIFEYSWERLSSKAQEILTRLSIFHGSFDLQAAQHVSQANLFELDTLNTAALIRFDAQTNRYSIHEIVRRLSYERLGEQREMIHRAHLDYFLQFTQQAESGLFGEHEAVWLDKVEVELNNIRAALAWADRQNLLMPILSISTRLYRFWRVRSFLTEGYQWMERGLSQADPIEESLHAKALGRIAALANLMGKKDRSVGYYQQALIIARANNNYERQAAILNGLAVIASQEQDYQTARAYYQECMEISRAHNYIHLLSVALLNSAVGYQEETNYAQAKTLLYESLALARGQGHTQNIADTLNNLGGIAFEEGDYALATLYLEESLALYQTIKNTANIMTVMHVFVNLYIEQSDLPKARALCSEMQTLSEPVDDQFIKALVAYTLGSMSLEDSAYDMAETYLTQAIEKFTQLNDKRMLVFSLNEMAHTAAHQGKQDKAIRLLGYGQTLVASYHLKLHAQANRRYQAIYDTLKASTSDDNFQRLWQQGEAMAQGKVITALL